MELTENCNFHLFAANGKRKRQPYIWCRVNKYTWIMELNIYLYILKQYMYIYAAVSNKKRKKEAQTIFLIHLLFAQHANRSLSFVRLLT